ncbi:metallophosphoesterase [Crocinitomicaceae bacterium]|nr:metallophosphoesterase [Crocinitomicaceae bacterium]
MRMILALFILSLFSSCKSDKIEYQNVTYLHVSHTRTNANPNLDATIEGIDYSKYDVLMLGGDLANLTSLDTQTMDHANSIFDFSSQSTLWALGNHDYTDLNLVESYTGRLPYYAYTKNGITFLVIDTQDDFSNISGNQKTFVDQVLDTISQSSHLVLLHHKLIWMSGNPYLESQVPFISNAGIGTCFYCINPNNFYSTIYPKLVTLSNAGTKVICVGGDIGFNSKEFEYLTPEGIHFLASGIGNGSSDNNGLVFHHNVSMSNLTWEFKLTSEL